MNVCTRCGEFILIGPGGCACTRAVQRKIFEQELEKSTEELRAWIDAHPEEMEKLRNFVEQEKAKSELYNIMHQLSENTYSAGWLNELEFRLWDLVVDKTPFGRMGEYEAKHTSAMLCELAKAAGGWWMWSKENTEVVFVPLKQWLEIYFARKDK